MYIFHSGKKSAQCSSTRLSQGGFDELGGIWDEWAISLPFSFKTVEPEKGSFIGLCSSDPKKDPSLSPGPRGAIFREALNHNAAVNVCEQLFIFYNIVSTMFHLIQY